MQYRMNHIINRKNYTFLLILSVFLMASVLFWNTHYTQSNELPAELIILWNADYSFEEASSCLAETFPELTLLEHDADFSLCSLSEGISSAALFRKLNNHPDILLAEPNYTMSLMEFTPPDDPYNNTLWGFDNTGIFQKYYGSMTFPQNSTEDVDMNLWEAWETYPLPVGQSRQVIVAVIDTGIDYKHPDLRNEMWINPGEIPENEIDDDGNGYVDDVYGWDFYNEDHSVCHYLETSLGYTAYPDDNDNHGTHCAGIIAATANNSIGIAGVASNVDVRLMSLKIHGGSSSSGSVSNAIKAIRYAEKMGAKICNMSWGTYNYSEALELIIRESNMLFVTAAGNNGGNNNSTPVFPASLRLPNLISVAFIDYNGILDPDSNYGLSTVDIAAPGKDIYSTFVGSYGYSSGSSMAAPHVTGLAAMIYAYREDIYPAQVKSLIIDTLKPLESLNGYVINPGIPNAALAIQSLDSLQPDEHAPYLLLENTFERSNLRVNIDAYDLGGSGVKTIRYLYGSRTAEAFRGDTNSTVIKEDYVLLTKPGYYTFYSEDFAGNATVQIHYVEEDITPPELTASYTVSEDCTSITVTLSVKDAESGIRSLKYLVGEHSAQSFLTGGDALASYLSSHTFTVSAEVSSITVYLGDYRGNTTVYVVDLNIIPAVSVHLTTNDCRLHPSDTLYLSTLLLPWNSTDSILYTSSDPSVATVDSSGKVTAVSEGTAFITVTSNNGAQDTCRILVE